MITIDLKTITDRLAENTDSLPVVYVAGKVTGLRYEDTYEKFKAKQLELEEQGFFVLNPCDLVNMPPNNWCLEMRVSLAALMCAQHICLLPDWNLSKGAKLERTVALALQLNAIYA